MGELTDLEWDLIFYGEAFVDQDGNRISIDPANYEKRWNRAVLEGNGTGKIAGIVPDDIR